MFNSIIGFSQAQLKIEDVKKNFGFVKRGTVVKSFYSVRNIGNKPLLISHAEVSCSCTQVDFPKQPLLPNDTALIVIHFDTKTVYGRQDRYVFIHSNDFNSPLKLRYKGVVSDK